MQNKTISSHKAQFAQDVYEGLKDFPKRLSSKYFYDEAGDKLFQEIMNMPEYYLTNAEYDILEDRKDEIVKWFGQGEQNISLIELGAGDGKKTKILLQHMAQKGLPFKYVPIDNYIRPIHQLSYFDVHNVHFYIIYPISMSLARLKY